MAEMNAEKKLRLKLTHGKVTAFYQIDTRLSDEFKVNDHCFTPRTYTLHL